MEKEKRKPFLRKWQKKPYFYRIGYKQEDLAKRYAEFLGFKCLINNNNKQAILIDHKGQRAFLHQYYNDLYYLFNRNFTLIDMELIGQIGLMNKILPKTKRKMPTAILRKLFGFL